MVAPKGIPQEALDKLIDALNKALDDPNTKARYVELGSTAPKPEDRGPAGAQKLVASEVARISPVLKAAMAKAAETEKTEKQ
jgi:tripartite-type tricarboxylate transporter receptor subunit TctC